MMRLLLAKPIIWGLLASGAVAFLITATALLYMLWMPGKSRSNPAEIDSNERRRIESELERHVRSLSEQIGPRSTMHPRALAEAAHYVEAELKGAGYLPERQEVILSGGQDSVYNIYAELSGQDPSKVVVIGAHYDSFAPSTPGANDNASGVASMLVLSRRLFGERFEYSVLFAGFVNEEEPYFLTDQMGSVQFARLLKEQGREVIAMLSLETMGYFSDRPGSQKYPAPLSHFYPDRGNFIGFVGNLRSASTVRRTIRLFREASNFPAEGIAAPESIPGIGWSDHAAFWREGFPGVMITDTAPYRYPDYHQVTDTWEKIDYGALAEITIGLNSVVAELAGRTGR